MSRARSPSGINHLSNQGELGCEGLKIGPAPVTQCFFLNIIFPKNFVGFWTQKN